MIYGYARASTDGQTAKVEGDRHVIEGDQTGGDGRASLFMDRFGFASSAPTFQTGLRPAPVSAASASRMAPASLAAPAIRGASVGAAAVGGAAAAPY